MQASPGGVSDCFDRGCCSCASYHHDLAALNAACVELHQGQLSWREVVIIDLAAQETSHPMIWKELRVSLGLPEE